MYAPVFSHVQGYSGVDHVGEELAWHCAAEVEGRRYKTRAAAISAGRSARLRVIRRLRASGEGVWRHSLPAIRVDALPLAEYEAAARA